MLNVSIPVSSYIIDCVNGYVGAKRLNPAPNASNSAYGGGGGATNQNHGLNAAHHHHPHHNNRHDATNTTTPSKGGIGGIYGLGSADAASHHKPQPATHSLRNQGSASLSHGAAGVDAVVAGFGSNNGGGGPSSVV